MGRKDNDVVYLIPEGQTRESHDYHYTISKKKKLEKMLHAFFMSLVNLNNTWILT